MKKVVKERKDIAFYIILYPLPMHKDAYEKTKAIMCERSMAMLEDAFDGKPIPKATCDTKIIDENIELANKLGINGTPALIFPDGTLNPGPRDAASIIKWFDKK